MATTEDLQECMALLQGAYGVFGWSWREDIEDRFRFELALLDGGVARRAVEKLVLFSTWPPAPADILPEAARLIRPILSDLDAFDWILATVRDTDGMGGTLRVETPDFPHSTFEGAVSDVGGWEVIRESLRFPAMPIVVLQPFVEAYRIRQTAWYEAVQQEIRKKGGDC
jgi:hypothetical protein